MTNAERIRTIAAFLAPRYAANEYPALLAQADRFGFSQPFAGKSILDCTPLFANTLAKFIPLLAGGADLSVGTCPRIPHDPKIVEFLASAGIPCLSEAQVPARQPDAILDCDGSRAALEPKAGVCELTRSGIYRYGKRRFPVVLVDSSKIKEIETGIGTGDGFMRAMHRLGHDDWHERKVVVFGYGKVGRGVAFKCAKAGAAVTAVDRPGTPSPFPTIGLDDPDAVLRAVADCDVLVTATGVRGAMRRFGLGRTIREHDNIIIAAIGIEDEWLGDIPPSRILNNGEAVNFLLDEPTLLRYIDPTMALSNESAADLLSGEFTASGIVPPKAASERRCLDPVIACGLITAELREMRFI